MSHSHSKGFVRTTLTMLVLTIVFVALLGACAYYDPYQYYYAQPYGEYHVDYPYDAFYFYERNREYEFYYPYDENTPHRYYFESR